MIVDPKNLMLDIIATIMRQDILIMTCNANSGHPGGSLSATDILATLYFGKTEDEEPIMNYNAKEPWSKERDYFILSKGHAVPVLYSVLARAGYFPVEELYTLRKINSRIQGHPSPETPGVEVATGSLGQGLSIANGIAMALKVDGLTNKVFVLVGDGELQEGQVWEAAMSSGHYKLDNICLIIDHNGLQIDGPVRDVMDISPLMKKFESFGWDVINVEGHDFSDLRHAFTNAIKNNGKPTAILAYTIKGKGVHFMEGEPGYHGKCIKKQDLEIALGPLKKRLELIYEKNSGIKEEVEKRFGKCLHELKPTCLPSVNVQGGLFEKKEWIPTRNAYGKSLAELGKRYKDVVVLDADLSESTKSIEFAKQFPKRFFNLGIAEQDLIGTTVGFALKNKIPFANSFSSFITCRPFDQIRLAAYSNKNDVAKVNAVLVGSHGGIQPGEDGPSHHSIEDIALMRVIPGMTVLVPADCIEVKSMVGEIGKYKSIYNEMRKEFGDEVLREIIKRKELPNKKKEYMGESIKEILRYKGLFYIRNCRNPVPVIFDDYPDYEFELGKAYTFGSGSDVSIIATGVMVHKALEAQELLWKEGIKSRVVNMSTIKPIDEETIKKCAKETGLIVTVEDHSVVGGLGDEVANVLFRYNINKGINLRKIGVSDTYAESGNHEELFEKYGLSSEAICKTVKEGLKK
jgi:transketolase